jgi:predicted MFS family arabinose efflux permease
MTPFPVEGILATGPAQRGARIRLISWMVDKKLSREFWIFFLAALCFDFGFAMFLFLYNLFLLDIGFNERQLGFIAGAMTLGGVVATIPMGMFAQRAGLRRALSVGFVMTPLLSAARTVVTGEHAQVGLAFVGGMFLCTWGVCFSPAAAKLTTENNRTFAFSLLFSVGIGTGGIGGLVGGCLPGWLQRISPGMHPADAKRAVLLLCCGIVALGLWPVLRLRLDAGVQSERSAWRFDPYLWRFLPAVALWSLVAGSFMPFATVYLSRQVHVPLSHIGFIFSASQMAQVVAVLLAPAVFRRRGLVAGIMYTQIATAVALAGLARAHTLPLIVPLYLTFTAFHWMGGPGIYSLLMSRVAEGNRSNASAANSLATSLSQAAASAAAGAAYVDFGYPRVLSAIACIAAIAAVAFWALLRDQHGIAIGPADDKEVTNTMQEQDNCATQ